MDRALTFDTEVGISRCVGALCVGCHASISPPAGEAHLRDGEHRWHLLWNLHPILEPGDAGLGVATGNAGEVHRLVQRGKNCGWSSFYDRWWELLNNCMGEGKTWNKWFQVLVTKRIPFSQLMPLNPSGQLQLYEDWRLEQEPPFRQGVLAQ